MLHAHLNRTIEQIVVLSWLIALTSLTLYSQSGSYDFEVIPLPDELEGFTGRDFLQDKDGFIWICTNRGLLRYDGANFKHYSLETSDGIDNSFETSGMVSDFVYSPFEDSDGAIWFVNQLGLTQFDKETEIFNHYYGPQRGYKYMAVECSDGYIWVGSAKGLNRFDKAAKTYRTYSTVTKETFTETRNQVYLVYEDHQGTLWVNYLEGGIAIFDREKETFNDIDNIPAPVQDLLEDRSGRFWVTTKDGLYLFARETGSFHRWLNDPGDPDALTDQFLGRMIQGKNGDFWISTHDGIYHYSEDLKKLGYWIFFSEPSQADNQTDPDFPYGLYLDQHENLWFFLEKRIGKLNRITSNFSLYDPVDTVYVGQSRIDVKDKFFIANRSDLNYGYFMLDRSSHTSTKLLLENMSENSYVRYSLRDRKGNLWITTWGKGLYRGKAAENGTVIFEHLFSDPKDSTNVPSLDLVHLFEDSDGRIWIEARDHGPCYYDPEEDRIIHLVNNPGSRDKLPVKDVTGIALGSVQGETNQGVLLGSHRTYGIFAIIPPFIRVSEHAVMPSDIIRFRIADGTEKVKGWDMYQSPKDTLGIIWARGVNAVGFQKFTLAHPDRKDDFTVTRRVFLKKDGMLSSQLYCFEEDQHGNMWIGTAAGGLSRLDTRKNVFTNYTIEDGIPGMYVISSDKSQDGELFFTTENGSCFSFFPDSLQLNRRIPPVFLTDIRINNVIASPKTSPLLDSILPYIKSINLPYRQNNISISYAALNYVHPGKNQYRYQLDGFHDKWQYAGNRTTVDFTNLKPGRYTFRVIGSNNNGIWNEKGAELAIRITPPPWKTIWAYFFYAVVTSGSFLAYRRFLIRREEMKNALQLEHLEKEKIEEIGEMKSRFFANISHEFRTPLTLILGPIEDLIRKKPERAEISWDILRMMRRNALRLQQMINQVLDLSKLETGKMKLHVSEGVLEQSAEILLQSYLSHAERKKIRYRLELPGSYLKVYFDRDKFEKILTNLLTNAFKFTPENGSITVLLSYLPDESTGQPEQAILKVTDTGKGIPVEHIDRIFERFYQANEGEDGEKEGSGIGLALTRELVELCHGQICVESQIGQGSTFSVTLPVSREAFSREEILTEKKEKVSGPIESSDSIINKKIPINEIKKTSPRREYDKTPFVLLVEDNDDLSTYMSKILSAEFSVKTAKNGKEGLEIAWKNIPDLVISDVMMPEMDGNELARHLKQDERTDHVPVILLTAKADEESKMTGLGTGVDAYLTKPFNIKELTLLAENLIHQRKLMREKFRNRLMSSSAGQSTMLTETFPQKLIGILEKNLSNPDFTMEDLGKVLHMSRAQLYRKVNAIAGVSPHELLRMMRMKRAARLLESGEYNVTQVMYQVGMQNTSYFARSFHHYYEVNPSDYRDSHSK